MPSLSRIAKKTIYRYTDQAHNFFLTRTTTPQELRMDPPVYHPLLVSEWLDYLLRMYNGPTYWRDNRPEEFKATDQSQLTHNPPLTPIWRDPNAELDTFIRTQGQRTRPHNLLITPSSLIVIKSIADHFGIWGDVKDGHLCEFSVQYIAWSQGDDTVNIFQPATPEVIQAYSLFPGHAEMFQRNRFREPNKYRYEPSLTLKVGYVLDAIGREWLVPTSNEYPPPPMVWTRQEDRNKFCREAHQEGNLENYSYSTKHYSSIGKAKVPHSWNPHPPEGREHEYQRGQGPYTKGKRNIFLESPVRSGNPNKPPPLPPTLREPDEYVYDPKSSGVHLNKRLVRNKNSNIGYEFIDEPELRAFRVFEDNTTITYTRTEEEAKRLVASGKYVQSKMKAKRRP